MTSLLERLSKTRQQPYPQTLDDILAVEIARLLGDRESPELYRRLIRETGRQRLIATVRQTLATLKPDVPPWRQLQDNLRAGTAQEYVPSPTLISIHISSRYLASAYFRGSALLQTDRHAYSSDLAAAERSVLRAINRLCTDNKAATVALCPSPATDTRTSHLYRAALSALRSAGLSIWEIERPEVCTALGLDPNATSIPLGRVAGEVWPQLTIDQLDTTELQAVALGTAVYARLLLHVPAPEKSL